jgi:hypothetical protein
LLEPQDIPCPLAHEEFLSNHHRLDKQLAPDECQSLARVTRTIDDWPPYLTIDIGHANACMTSWAMTDIAARISLTTPAGVATPYILSAVHLYNMSTHYTSTSYMSCHPLTSTPRISKLYGVCLFITGIVNWPGIHAQGTDDVRVFADAFSEKRTRAFTANDAHTYNPTRLVFFKQ